MSASKLPIRNDRIADSSDIKVILQTMLRRIETLERRVGELQRKSNEA